MGRSFCRKCFLQNRGACIRAPFLQTMFSTKSGRLLQGAIFVDHVFYKIGAPVIGRSFCRKCFLQNRCACIRAQFLQTMFSTKSVRLLQGAVFVGSVFYKIGAPVLGRHFCRPCFLQNRGACYRAPFLQKVLSTKSAP